MSAIALGLALVGSGCASTSPLTSTGLPPQRNFIVVLDDCHAVPSLVTVHKKTSNGLPDYVTFVNNDPEERTITWKANGSPFASQDPIRVPGAYLVHVRMQVRANATNRTYEYKVTGNGCMGAAPGPSGPGVIVDD